MPQGSTPKRPLTTTLTLLALWIVFYASFTLVRPALLDDADSVHAEVAREMLLRHDWVTLYANGIRYLEKAPVLYWSMAACMRAAQMFFVPHSSRSDEWVLAIAARIPLALTVLILAFAVETFARQAFRSARTGLYTALILLSSPGIFLYTRILLPDVMLCLWLTLAMYYFWLTESRDQGTGNREQNRVPRPSFARAGDDDVRVPHSSRSDEWDAKGPGAPSIAALGDGWDVRSRVPHSSQSHRDEWDVRIPVPHSSQPHRDEWDRTTLRTGCYGFAVFCALGVLTKGFIGVVFPIGIIALYLLLTRGLRGPARRVLELHPLRSTLLFLAVAAPWHILAAFANPTQGSPGGLTYASGHFSVPLPTPGNVHGWAWFYFVNEQVLRYLNLRVPRDYGTVPLYLFWGLILIWLMPWSAFLFNAIASALRSARSIRNTAADRAAAAVSLKGTASAVPQDTAPEDAASAAEVTARSRTDLLLLVWAALPLVFFSFSTRQEYYVLPSLPALALLIAAWIAKDSRSAFEPITEGAERTRRPALRCTTVLVAVGAVFAAVAIYFLLHTHTPAPNADLASLLQQNPGDYALSMGHFLDLDTRALSLFRVPLALAAAGLLLGPLASYLLRRVPHPSSAWVGSHAANLALAAGAFTFLLAVHMGYATFAPVLSSAQLAEAIRPQLQPDDLLVIHQEYEYASTLGFYLQRPSYGFAGLIERPVTPGKAPAPLTAAQLARLHLQPVALNPIHILTDPSYHPAEQVPGSPYGRSSNLYYGSFFPDAPPIFETPATLAARWHGTQRIFLWQSLDDQPSPLPAALSPAYVIARSGGKEIVSNQPNYR